MHYPALWPRSRIFVCETGALAGRYAGPNHERSVAMGENGSGGPLKGIRVLEFGSLLAGPFCARLLADFGADVIKVESPGEGDPLRHWNLESWNGRDLLWSIQARNKRCITLNLRSPEGQQVVRQLAEKTDIVVENFRPGTMEKWGLGAEDPRTHNP